MSCSTAQRATLKLDWWFIMFVDKVDYCLRATVISRQLSGHRALLPLSPTSVLYKIDLGEAPFSLQTMRNETHKKARWKSAIKKKGGRDRARERGRERARLNTIGEKSRAGKRVLKNATNDKQRRQQHGGQHNTVTTYSRHTPEAHQTGKKQRRRA